jgi:hypothetical protein
MSQQKPYRKSSKTDTVGGRLRTARLAAGLTQTHLSEIIHQNCSQWTIDDAEDLRKSPLTRARVLEKAKAILKDVSEFLA